MVFNQGYISESAKELFKNADTQVPPSRDWDLVDEMGRGGQQLFLLRAPPVILKGSQAKTADKARGIPRRL